MGIVIKDDSLKLSLFIFIFSMTGMYILAFTIPDTQFTQTNLMISISIFVLPVLYKTLPFVNEKNEILINDDGIRRQWGDEIIEIKWSSNVVVEKTFIDFYDKRQAESSWQRYIGAIFNVLIENPLTIVAKVIYHLFKSGLKDYKFFDTIIIREGENMIAILINNH